MPDVRGVPRFGRAASDDNAAARSVAAVPHKAPLVSSSAPSAAASEDYEFVCYGDRVCFLCDGQLLALAHKLNLSYQQMALLALATAASGGLMGLAGFFVWRRGLFRKRYAALCSDDLYDDVDAPGDGSVRTEGGVPVVGAPADGFDRKMRGTNRENREQDSAPGLVAEDEDISLLEGESDPPAAHPHYSTRHQHEAVTFRLFAFDPETQQLDFSKVGMPVRFGSPVVVVHASSNRALRFQSRTRGGAVTLSRPPINLNFHKQVRACIEAAGAAPVPVPGPATSGSGPQPTDEVADAKNHAAGRHKSRQEPRSTPLPSLAELSHYHQSSGPSNAASMRPPRRSLDLSPYLSLLDNDSSDSNSMREQALSHGDDLFGPAVSTSTSAATTQSSRGRGRADRAGGLWRQIMIPNAPTSTPTRRRSPQSSSRFYRSISESYLSFVADLNDSLARQRERRELRKRQRKLMKHLPNMSFAHPGGKLYVATLYSIKHHASGNATHSFGASSSSSSASTTTGSGHSLMGALPPEEDEFLRWGAPMGLMAAFSHQPCEVAPRGEYYKDSRLYLSTCGEASTAPSHSPQSASAHPTTTLIPLRECGDDLACLARESTRLLARAQRRRVTLRVGTYNVWMLPRKVSMFTAVSPRKNTRARLMAEVLPACDVWVFTECFDHRSRKVLLDKLSESGYYFSTPTVGHNKRMSKGGKTYVRKLINGGVLVASRYPILSVRIKLFGDASCGADRLADKGVLYAKILKEGLLVHVFATHFQAWNDAASRAVRRTQMEMVKSFMASLSIDPENDVVLLVGDLNVDYWLNKTSGEYDEMLELLELRDSAAGGNGRASRSSASSTEKDKRCLLNAQRSAKFSFDRRLNALAADGLSSDGSLELLDYVLYSKTHRQPTRAASWVLPLRSTTPWQWRKQPQFNLSDHFPVVSELSFDM